jgi:hypothetical protein
MWPDSITLNRESRLDWNTNDGSIYTGGSHYSVNGARTCIYIFHRTDDIPLTQLGEIRSWIKDGQRRLAFVVGNFYDELVCSKILLESEDMYVLEFSLHVSHITVCTANVARRRTFTTCPTAGAFKNDVWRLIWQYLPTCSRWKVCLRDARPSDSDPEL